MGLANFFTANGTTTLSVARNTPVTWTNDSGTDHDVTFDNPGAAMSVAGGPAGNIPQHPSGSSNQRQFAVTGSFPFYCTIHGPTMRGTVAVTP
jgi:plastocyanin